MLNWLASYSHLHCWKSVEINGNVFPADEDKEELLVFKDLAEPKGKNVRIVREVNII